MEVIVAKPDVAPLQKVMKMNSEKHPDPMKCECLFWAREWSNEEIEESLNKHHPRCEYSDEEQEYKDELGDHFGI